MRSTTGLPAWAPLVVLVDEGVELCLEFGDRGSSFRWFAEWKTTQFDPVTVTDLSLIQFDRSRVN